MTARAGPPSIATDAEQSLISNPLVWLALAVILCCALLCLPLVLPIGAMYWDLYVYYDAANRIFDGQIPIVDFFAPVGPLGYYLFAAGTWLFPNAQPTLLAHWSLLPVTAPLMALVLWNVGSQSKTLAFLLLAPFLLYALLPFNTRSYSTFPGSDGFGIYNRQVCQLLYVLVAALMFVRRARLLAIIVGATMAALFFVKITGFVAGGVICAFAFATGRVTLKYSLAILVAFAAILGIVELYRGMVSQYLADIAALVQMNSGTLLPRFLQASSLNFGILLPTVILVFTLLWTGRKRLIADLGTLRSSASLQTAMKLLDHHALWLGVVLFAGILFETQNTGSQPLIFLWPVTLAILLSAQKLLAKPIQLFVVAGLVAAIVLPPAMGIIERAGRAYISGLRNQPLESANLKTLGNVSMRKQAADRSKHMMGFYSAHRSIYQGLVPMGELPSETLYADFDFQIIQLRGLDEAAAAIKSIETDKGLRFETIMAINFVNVLPWLLDRSAPYHIAIGADPFRAVPPPGPLEEKAVADADLIVEPVCPPTTANAALLNLYRPGMDKHLRIKLTDCYDAFVHPKFAVKLGG